MAKKREERREARQQKRALKSGTSAEDYAKIKAADESVVASNAAKKQKEDEAKRKEKEYNAPKAKRQRRKAGKEFQREFEKSKKEQDAARAKADPNWADTPGVGISSTSVDPVVPEAKTETPTINGKADIKGETVKNIIEKEDSFDAANAVAGVAETVNNATQEIAEDIDKEGDAIKKTIEEGSGVDSEEGGTRTTDEGYQYAGDGSAIAEAAKTGDGKYDAGSMTEEEFARAKAAYQADLANQKSNAAQPAIKELGIEHYYPPQQDIVTSNFTGRYIGSRTLVSGADALYPEGLIDARKRAVEAKASAKAAANEKYWELADTATQYDEDYKDIGMELLDKYGEASGWDFDNLYKSKSELGKQFRKDMYDYKSRGKHLLELDTRVKELQKDFTDPNKYVPPEIKKMMLEFMNGTADMEAYMRGEAIGDKRMQAMSNMFRSYQNFTPLMNDQLAKLKELGLNEMPLAKGTNFNDETFAANVEGAIAKSSDLNWDKYTEVMSKYYDIEKAKDIVRGIYEHNQLWEGASNKEQEEILNSSTRLFLSHLGKSVNIEQKFIDRKTLGWANLRQRKSEWETKKKWREEDYLNYYKQVNDEAELLEPGALTSMKGQTTKDARQKALMNYWSKNGKKPVNIGGIVAAEMPTTGAQSVGLYVTDNTLVRGKDGIIRPIKNEIKLATKEGRDDDVKELQRFRGKEVRQHVNTRHQGYSVLDEEKGYWTPAENYSSVGTTKSQNVVYRTGGVAIAGDTAEGQQEVINSTYEFVQVNPISSDTDQRSLSDDEKRGQEGANRYYTEPGDYVGESSSSGSSD
jgi:hypothetical protein